MKILAIDTATEACSAALFIDNTISEQYRLAPREHTDLILKMIEQLLQQAALKLDQLDALAFGRGPGSFTGVRIATGIVQGLAFATDLPVLGVSTLASIAQSVHDDHQHPNILAAMDARMGEIYWGCYQVDDSGQVCLRGEEQVARADALVLPDDGRWCIAGSACESYSSQLSETLGTAIEQQYADYYPRAGSLVKLAARDYARGLAVPAAQALPVYLRDNVAKKISEQGGAKI